MPTNLLVTNDISTNTELVQQFLEQFWNQKDLASAATFLAAEYIDHAYQPANQQGLLQIMQVLGVSFPDHTHVIEETVAQNDLVVLRMRFHATHLGDFRGHPASGKAVDVSAYRMYRVNAGRITDHWALFDTASLFQQINGL